MVLASAGKRERPRSPPDSTRNGVRLLRGEQEIPHVADHVLRLVAHDHRVAAPAGQGLANGQVRVETFAPLVEGRHRGFAPCRTVAVVGRERADQEADQRGLAAAVRPDDAERSPRMMRMEKSRTMGRGPKLLPIPSASITSAPDCSASAAPIVALPTARR